MRVNVATRSSKVIPTVDAPASEVNDNAVRNCVPASSSRDDIVQGYLKDPWFADARNVSQLVEKQGLYLKHSAVVILDHADLRSTLLHEFHNAPYAWHLGVYRTTKLIEKDYWWPALRSDVLLHVNTCGACQRGNGATQRPFGEAQPLAVPEYQWKDISMDFITHLPPTRSGYTSILVVVDGMFKISHFLPTVNTTSAKDVVALFRDRVFCFHGMPQSIVPDRDIKFTSAFWKELHKLLPRRSAQPVYSISPSD